VINREKFI